MKNKLNRRNIISPEMKILMLAFLFSISVFITGCTRYANNSDLLFYKDSTGLIKPVKTRQEWELKREQILDSMQAAMGKLPSWSGLPQFDMKVTDSLIENTYTRYRINFAVAPNERVPANLYVPLQKGTKIKLPAMLAVYYFDPNGKTDIEGKGQDSYWAYARELAERGYVVIAPDYPGYGDLKDYKFGKFKMDFTYLHSVCNYIFGLEN